MPITMIEILLFLILLANFAIWSRLQMNNKFLQDVIELLKNKDK